MKKIAQYRVYSLTDRPDMAAWMERLGEVINNPETIARNDVFHGLLNALGQVTKNLNIPHDMAVDAFVTCLQRQEAKANGIQS